MLRPACQRLQSRSTSTHRSTARVFLQLAFPVKATARSASDYSRAPRVTPRDARRAKDNRGRRPVEENLSKRLPEAIRLSKEEVSSIYSQELFVFRYDVSATQIRSAMAAYPKLRDVEVLTENDICQLVKEIHFRFHVDKTPQTLVPYLGQIIEDLKAMKIPWGTKASVHAITALKQMQEYDMANEFWTWCHSRNENICDSTVYGAAIELFTQQGLELKDLERMYEEAIERYAKTTVASVARETGRGLPLGLLQGIMTARLMHNDWRKAYEALDLALRLDPTGVPSRIFELFTYQRPIREAYIVFLIACRAGIPMKKLATTALLREVWTKTKDVRALLKLVSAYVGAGGKPTTIYMNMLIDGLLGALSTRSSKEEVDVAFQQCLKLIKSLVTSFARIGVRPTAETFNAMITYGGTLSRSDLITIGLKEMLHAKLSPTDVTYRVLILSYGRLCDFKQVQDAWAMLCKTRSAKKELPIDKDWIAFIKACFMSGNRECALPELERFKGQLDPLTYEKSLKYIQNFRPRAIYESFEGQDSASHGSSLDNLESDLEELRRVFYTNELDNFSNRTDLFQIFSNDPMAPDELPEEDLWEAYKKFGDEKFLWDSEKGTSATGLGVDQLRYENWKSINRLLYEAEIYEKEQDRLKQMKVNRTLFGSSDGVGLAEKKEPTEDKGKTTTSIEGTKDGARADSTTEEKQMEGEQTSDVRAVAEENGIFGQIDRVRKRRNRGKSGWREDEMMLRGLLGAGRKIVDVKFEQKSDVQKDMAEERVEGEEPWASAEEEKRPLLTARDLSARMPL